MNNGDSWFDPPVCSGPNEFGYVIPKLKS